MITFEHVSHRFGRAKVLEDVSLTIAAGESVALWGRNGAGKSTLIRCLLGLLRCGGRVTVGGHDVLRDGKRARMLIGYVPQELGFYDDLGVAAAVQYFASFKAVRVPDVDAVLSRVGLGGQGGKRIRELSGGMKQRLALAVALLGDPPVLVLDEVTASLDACGRGELVAVLAGLAGAGRTMLFASHRTEEIAALAERVVTLEGGRKTGECAAPEFVRRAAETPVLQLRLRGGVPAEAIGVLRDRGFDARSAGTTLFVPVSAERKAIPLCVLAEAGIAVDDFELAAGRPEGER